MNSLYIKMDLELVAIIITYEELSGIWNATSLP